VNKRLLGKHYQVQQLNGDSVINVALPDTVMDQQISLNSDYMFMVTVWLGILPGEADDCNGLENRTFCQVIGIQET
jgi:hypothetical protein